MRPSQCRLCKQQQLACLGSIPDSDYFAGRVLEQPIAGGQLWFCGSCRSMFRHPVLSESDYEDLYVAGASDSWSSDGGRIDLDVIRAQIGQLRGVKAVLDVGCGAGGFLATLPKTMQKFGVEPSASAAAAASRAGITVAGRSLADLQPGVSFDVITVIDVIEHVTDPLGFLDQAVAHLAPGGTLIVATGDPGFFLWRRVFRSRFWYSAFPEHITFLSMRVLDQWRQRHGLDPPATLQIRYRILPFWKLSAHFCIMLAFLLSPNMCNAVARMAAGLRSGSQSKRRYFTPGAPGVFADHQVVTFVQSVTQFRVS
jgi:SAM-dependent methyltransferase